MGGGVLRYMNFEMDTLFSKGATQKCSVVIIFHKMHARFFNPDYNGECQILLFEPPARLQRDKEDDGARTGSRPDP